MIVVTPLSGLPRMAMLHRPSHVLTLLSPGSIDAPDIDMAPERHLRLYFHDIIAPRADLIMPTPEMVSAIIAFGHGWTGAHPLLVHCWAGISRSSAAAYILACAKNPGRELEIANALRQRAPFATPNRLMVELADTTLGAARRMVNATDHIGRGADAFEGMPYEFPIRFGLN